MIDKIMLEEIINTTPLALLTLNVELINQANDYLPYSTGFEIECDKSEIYDKIVFLEIPNILDVQVDSCEQRYRIPNGVNGLICLYHICHHLSVNSLLNTGSGIHYHIDCTDCYDLITNKFLLENEEWILKELDDWGFKGEQTRGIYGVSEKYGSWLKKNGLKTLEFRIGNMSFDYKVLVKNIISANSIVRRLKQQLGYIKVEYKDIIKSILLDYQRMVNENTINDPYKKRIFELNQQLEEINSKTISSNTPLEIIKESIRNRSHRIN